MITVADLKKIFPKHRLTRPDRLVVEGVSKDTRTLKPGELYVAIKGERYDGHTFVEQSFKQGAIAALVSLDSERDNVIVVPDTVEALSVLAQFYRGRLKGPLMAITGSSGKTTTKDLLCHVLRQTLKIEATGGNLNNHIGVPLTVLSFTPGAEAYIVEMGMSHLGEIGRLTAMVRPNLGLITNIGHAHLEGVGTVENVAKAKGELFLGLSPEDRAFVNADDPFIARMATPATRVTYGFAAGCDYRAGDVAVKGEKTDFSVTHGGQRHTLAMALFGDHHVTNSVGVFAVAHSFHVPVDKIREGLLSFSPATNRGRRFERASFTVIDDSYNANPDSMLAAFHSVRAQYPDVCKIAALGGMLELGEEGASWHTWVGERARETGFAEIFVTGNHAQNYLKGFGYTKDEQERRIFGDHTSLVHGLLSWRERHKGPAVLLIKGSRGMTMEKVLEFL